MDITYTSGRTLPRHISATNSKDLGLRMVNFSFRWRRIEHIKRCLVKASESSEESSQFGEESPPNSMVDWREFRARLVQGGLREADTGGGKEESAQTLEASSEMSSSTSPKPWAHPLVKPEKGCLLIAHPSSFGKSQQYFFKAVIFMLWHSAEGSYGIILNRPTNYTLDSVAGFSELMPEFSGSRLYLGGDVGASTTRVLHKYGDLEGSDEVIKGVYVGGYSAAKEHVQSGKSVASDFRWFARYAGWAPGQLESEVAAGAWFLGSCSSDLILRHCEDNDILLWSEVMELMGGEFAEIARKSSK